MKKRIIFSILIIIILISTFIIIQKVSITRNNLKKLQSELESKEKELERLKQPEIKEVKIENITNQSDVNKPNLTKWLFADVFDGIRKVAIKANFSDNYTYVYNDDGSFFSRKGPIFPVDPFSQIVYNDIGFEVRYSHFRAYNLGEGKNGLEKYNDYIDKIGRKDMIDNNMTCNSFEECRNVKLIKCDKSNQSAHIWYIDTYLFSAYDSGEMLGYFKTFYC